MAVSYSGDKGGVRKSLYVIGPNGDFKGVLPTSTSTCVNVHLRYP